MPLFIPVTAIVSGKQRETSAVNQKVCLLSRVLSGIGEKGALLPSRSLLLFYYTQKHRITSKICYQTWNAKKYKAG